MKLIENVESSQIEKIGWCNDNLTITFKNGAVWLYEDVSYAEYRAMVISESKGHFLNTMIKPNKSATKLSM